LAHAKRASVLTDISVFIAKPAELAGVREQARKAAERAVALAPGLGEAHLTLAAVRAWGLLDFAGAATEFDRALALAPGSARVQMNFAGFAGQLGHFQPAIIAARRAVALDPQNVQTHVCIGAGSGSRTALRRGADGLPGRMFAPSKLSLGRAAYCKRAARIRAVRKGARELDDFSARLQFIKDFLSQLHFLV